VSEKVAPLSVILGAIKLTFPPKVVLGPTVIAVVAPVKVKEVASVPNCVKRGNNKLPPVNPDAPIEILFPVASEVDDVPFELKLRLPFAVLFNTMFPPKAPLVFAAVQNVILPEDVLLNKTESATVNVEFAISQKGTVPVDELVTNIFPPKVVLPIYANLTLLAPVFTTVTSLL